MWFQQRAVRAAFAVGLASSVAGCAGAALNRAAEANASCIRAVRAQPQYATILPHLDNSSGQFSMEELTDNTLPTPEEAKLLSSYYDGISPCINRFIASYSSVSPDVGAAYAEAHTGIQAIYARWIERRTTWGDGAMQIEKTRLLLRQDLAAIADAQAARQRRAWAAFSNYVVQEQAIQAEQEPRVIVVTPSP